jgi:dTDP-4-dehydrorhamnose 3,5-epimerase
MKFTPQAIPGVVLIEPKVFPDERGFFLETFHERRYRENGIPANAASFVQDNQSRSVRGTLRGLHSQRRQPQGKLVRAIEGEIFDVAVDVRRGSPTFAKWVGVRLSAENFLQLYVPPGFVHGFCVLSEVAQVEYKCTDFYAPNDEQSVIWNDPDIGIEWPVAEPVISPKDRVAPRLAEILQDLPAYDAEI